MAALTSSDVAAGDTASATQYNNLRTDVSSHAARHITSGEDLVDGDKLDIDWDPSNYTPDSSIGEADDADDLAAHLKGIDDGLPVTREFFVPTIDSNGTFGTGTGTPLAHYIDSGEEALIVFAVPADFSSITEAVIVVIPGNNAVSSWDIDLETNYGADGEAYTTHNETDTSSTYDFSTADSKWKEIDISGLLSSLAANDYVHVEIENNQTDDLAVLGVRFKYS